MALISPSVVNASTASLSATKISSLTSGTISPPSNLSSQLAAAVNTTTTGVSVSALQQASVVQTLVSSVGSLATLASTAANTAASSLTNLAATGIASVTSGISAALKSVTATFSGSVKDLASGLDGNLAGIFNDTNVKTAATTITNLSDPIKTNLLGSAKKTPTSSIFKVSSLEAGSQTVSSSGSSSSFGTNASTMVGTQLSTVLNRLNLDNASSALGGALTTAKSTQALGSLFSNPTKLVTQVTSATKSLVPTITAAATKALANDLSAVIGKTSSITSLTGSNVLNYVITDPSKSLIKLDGSTASTSANADAVTGNMLLSLARQLGCSLLDGEDYTSAAGEATLFNYLVSETANLGLTDLLDQLLECNKATSATGQQALTNAFTGVSGSDVGIAATLLDAIASPILLGTSATTTKIVTNPNLAASDAAQVESILTAIGSSTPKALAVDSLYDPDLIVYDYSVLGNMSESFRDQATGSSALGLYMSPNVQVLDGDGMTWT